jgi:hypothetical protein
VCVNEVLPLAGQGITWCLVCMRACCAYACAGNAAGSICSWKGTRLLKETPGHAPGPLMRRPDGVWLGLDVEEVTSLSFWLTGSQPTGPLTRLGFTTLVLCMLFLY